MNPLVKNALVSAFAVLIGGAAVAPGHAQTIVNDNDPSVVYSLAQNIQTPTSNWKYYTGGGDYAGDEHSTNFTRPGPAYQGASVSITFTGTQITWYGKKGPNYGYAVASLETGATATFNGYSPTEIDQNANVTLSAPYGYHVLTIKLLHRTEGSDYYQTIDYLKIVGGSAVPLSRGRVAGYPQWDSGSMAFNRLDGRCPHTNAGDWNCSGNIASDLSGGQFWDSKANDSVSYKFNGTLIEVYGRPDAENGYFTVTIDGKNYGTYDENFSNIDDDILNATLIFAAQVANGSHTITLAVVGRNDGYYSKGGTFLQLDEFVAFGGDTGGNAPVGKCQYELPPQAVGQRPVVSSLTNQKGASPPATFWDAGSNTELQRYQDFHVASNPYQNFTWTSVSPGFKVCTQGGSNLCLSASNGTIRLSTAFDIFQILPNSAILDVNACSFVDNPPGAMNGTNLTLGSTQTPWFASTPH
jgi:hypothetical protein